MILLDIAPLGGGLGIGLAVFFFLACLAVSFIVFKMLKRTVKMAIRMVIVAVILFVALIGTVAFLTLGSGGGGATKPPAKTTR
jgi:uncharacterized membrane protein YdbT with pleckstrin-like domain